MSAILKFYFPKREQLCFSEVHYLNYSKKTQFCMWQLHFSWNKGKQEQAMDPFHIPYAKHTSYDHMSFFWNTALFSWWGETYWASSLFTFIGILTLFKNTHVFEPNILEKPFSASSSAGGSWIVTDWPTSGTQSQFSYHLWLLSPEDWERFLWNIWFENAGENKVIFSSGARFQSIDFLSVVYRSKPCF